MYLRISGNDSFWKQLLLLKFQKYFPKIFPKLSKKPPNEVYLWWYIYSFIGVTHLVRIQNFRKNQPFLTPYTHKYEVLQIFLSVWPTFLAYCFQAIYHWELLFHAFFLIYTCFRYKCCWHLRKRLQSVFRRIQSCNLSKRGFFPTSEYYYFYCCCKYLITRILSGTFFSVNKIYTDIINANAWKKMHFTGHWLTQTSRTTQLYRKYECC